MYFADAARFPYGERTAGRARGVLARDRRGAARAADQAARGRVQLGDRGRAAGAARADDADDARGRRARRGPARGAAGRGGDPQRAHRRHGDAGDRRQRRLRGGDRGGRPVRRRRRASPARTSTRIIEAGFPFDQRVVDTVRAYCAPLRERGRHRDPRLHPLSARAPDAPALPRPRRGDRLLGRAGRAPGRARARLARARLAAGGRGRLLVPVHRATRRASARSARASCSCRSARSRRADAPARLAGSRR